MVKHVINNQSTFWFVQLGIWGGFALLNMLSRGYFSHFRLEELINSVTLFVALMSASVFLRRFYQSRHVDRWAHAIRWSVIGSLLGALIAFAIVLVVILSFREEFYGIDTKIAIIQILMSLPFLFVVLLCWSSVYLMIKRQRMLSLAQYRERKLKEQLATSQMDLLLNQLNPHFMFNAINNIRALILEDADRARESLAQLSEVLRTTLQVKQDKVWSLASEIELTKSFIKLNELQFEDRLVVNWQIDGNTQRWQVPTLVLQLLVENAIKHGIGKNPHGGQINIVIDASESLAIVVANRGKIEASPESTQLGITNISQRLDLLFGKKASFTLQQEDDWVKATIKLESLACTEQ